MRALLAADIAWRETDPGTDYAGDHRGSETVVALLQKFVELTNGTFTLEPLADQPPELRLLREAGAPEQGGVGGGPAAGACRPGARVTGWRVSRRCCYSTTSYPSSTRCTAKRHWRLWRRAMPRFW